MCGCGFCNSHTHQEPWRFCLIYNVAGARVLNKSKGTDENTHKPQLPRLDVKQSPNAQDTFRPMSGLFSCTVYVNSVVVIVHVHVCVVCMYRAVTIRDMVVRCVNQMVSAKAANVRCDTTNHSPFSLSPHPLLLPPSLSPSNSFCSPTSASSPSIPPSLSPSLLSLPPSPLPPSLPPYLCILTLYPALPPSSPSLLSLPPLPPSSPSLPLSLVYIGTIVSCIHVNLVSKLRPLFNHVSILVSQNSAPSLKVWMEEHILCVSLGSL